MKKKSIKPWIFAIIAPAIILLFIAYLQLSVRLLLNNNPGANNSVELFINLFSLSFGTLAMLLLLGMPLWIIKLIKTIQFNKTLKNSLKPPKKYIPRTIESCGDRDTFHNGK